MEMKPLTSIWRRGVVLPLTEDLACAMAQGFVPDDAGARGLPIETEALFSQLWASGLFQELNSTCQVIIDDYEEEAIPPESLQKALRAVEACRTRTPDLALREFLEELEMLIREAIALGFPVYFIL